MSCEEGKSIHGKTVEVIIRKQDEHGTIRSIRVTGDEAKKWSDAVDSQASFCWAHSILFPELKWEIMKDESQASI